jgi:hypothetical protein
MSLKNKTVAPPEKPDIRPLSSENLVERYHGRISLLPGKWRSRQERPLS